MKTELSDIADFFNEIVTDIEEGAKAPIKGYIELKMIEKGLKNSLKKISDEAYSDFGNWDRNDLPYNYIGNITNRLTVQYENDEEYSKIKEKLKSREEILKDVVHANEKGTTINDEEGNIIDCPNFSYKASLIVKKGKKGV